MSKEEERCGCFSADALHGQLRSPVIIYTIYRQLQQHLSKRSHKQAASCRKRLNSITPWLEKSSRV